MRLLKPDWVSHDGKPIFSIDIHPDGSRFATGGQGDNSGKVVIWNMAPVREEKEEKNEHVPKMLCTMDNHLACVNCVRWSNNGKFLASCGDDKLIMIWQTSRYSGVSTVFGSEGKLVNVEQWRCVNTLRGHSGDVLDVAWSPHDAWLASCSVDNTVVIWNANKFPEQISVLRGHTGLVKGVTWDPVGKYVASQSDDKSVRIWRTLDWQQESAVTEPFLECGGTTHVLRLGWSPDGHYLVSAHAMNNSGPTAQIIEREGWKTNMDFVGHRKAITVVRFNPNIFSKKLKKKSEKITALKRPLVITHDLFTSSILDITWSRNGMELLCCSWDGTVAFVDFTPEELGKPFSREDMNQLHRRVYGQSLTLNNNAQSSQIIETAAMLNIQQRKEETNATKDSTKIPLVKPVVNGQTPVKPALPPNTNKQIETKTPDGRRRIRPVLLAPQPEIGDAPLPFSSTASQPVFSSSTEKSRINIEKSNSPSDSKSATSLGPQTTSPGIATPHSTSTPSKTDFSMAQVDKNLTDRMTADKSVIDTSPLQPLSGLNGRAADKSITVTPTTSDKFGDKSKLKLGPKRKLDTSSPVTPSTDGPPPKKKDGRGRPRKDRTLEAAAAAAAVAAVTAVKPAAAVECESRVVYTATGLSLPISSIDRNISIQVAGAVGSESAVLLEVENDVSSGPGKLHRIQGVHGGRFVWETVMSSRAIAVAGNSHVAVIACEDQGINIFSSVGGQRLFPCMVLDSKVSVLRCSGFYIMVITSKGSLFVWNIQNKSAVIKNESLVSVIANSDIKLESSLLTEQGLPVVTVNTGKTFTFKVDLGCWVLLNHRSDTLHLCSDHQSSVRSGEVGRHTGPLATLQAAKHKAGAQASKIYSASHPLQQTCTLSHLENQVASCLALRSSQEYHFWFLTYVRYLVQEGVEARLREVCNDLLGPVYKSKTTSQWDPNILGHLKRNLLADILPIIGSNLRLQRLFTEYQEQLDCIKS